MEYLIESEDTCAAKKPLGDLRDKIMHERISLSMRSPSCIENIMKQAMCQWLAGLRIEYVALCDMFFSRVGMAQIYFHKIYTHLYFIGK